MMNVLSWSFGSYFKHKIFLSKNLINKKIKGEGPSDLVDQDMRFMDKTNYRIIITPYDIQH